MAALVYLFFHRFLFIGVRDILEKSILLKKTTSNYCFYSSKTMNASTQSNRIDLLKNKDGEAKTN